MSPAGNSLANSIKRKFVKLYPDAKVGIDGRGGWITVNGEKAINMSQASGGPMTDEEMIEKMHVVYAGKQVDTDVPTSSSRMYTFREGKMKITKRQLRKIIRESLLKEDRVLNLIRDEVSDVVKKDPLISNYIGWNEPNVVLAPYGTPGKIEVQLSNPELVPPERDMAMAAARFKRDLERLNPGYTFDIELDMYSAKDSQTLPEEDPDGFYRSSSASASVSYNITVNEPER